MYKQNYYRPERVYIHPSGSTEVDPGEFTIAQFLKVSNYKYFFYDTVAVNVLHVPLLCWCVDSYLNL